MSRTGPPSPSRVSRSAARGSVMRCWTWHEVQPLDRPPLKLPTPWRAGDTAGCCRCLCTRSRVTMSRTRGCELPRGCPTRCWRPCSSGLLRPGGWTVLRGTETGLRWCRCRPRPSRRSEVPFLEADPRTRWAGSLKGIVQSRPTPGVTQAHVPESGRSSSSRRPGYRSSVDGRGSAAQTPTNGAGPPIRSGQPPTRAARRQGGT